MDVIRLELELRFARNTVTGEVRTAGGAVRPFQGWLGLIAAIELERHVPPPPSRPAT